MRFPPRCRPLPAMCRVPSPRVLRGRCFPPVAVAALALLLGSLVPAARALACSGCVPLDDASGPAYLGAHPLGLYPGASNVPPAGHLALALTAAGEVVPRDAAGAPAANGWIGLLAIGMSNANQEFAVFERLADADPARNARLVLVDGAVGGQSADVIWNPSAAYWTTVLQRVRAAGLDADQVQAVWLKEAESSQPAPVFPAHAETLQAHVRAIVLHLKTLFPQLRLCFLASRIYGGYSPGLGLGEPTSYEGGFAMRWLIEDQATGDPGLNADPGAGPVLAPVLLWGPYLWANGTTPRASDGLTWQPGDLEADNVHPSPGGEAKVAALLDGFFNSDAAATPWYQDDPGADLDTLGTVADAHVDDAQPGVNFGSAGVLQWAHPGMRAFVKFDLESVAGTVLRAKLALKTPANTATRPIEVLDVPGTTWGEATITASNAPALGAVLDTIPSASRGTALGVDVTAEVIAALAQPPGSRRIAFGLRAFPGPSTVQEALSRESGEGPWLVLSLDPGTVSVAARDERGGGLAIHVHPNPSRGTAAVRLALAGALPEAEIAVFDVRGAEVRVLQRGALPAGTHRWSWDGRDASGRAVPAGIYWARIAGGGRVARARFALVP